MLRILAFFCVLIASVPAFSADLPWLEGVVAGMGPGEWAEAGDPVTNHCPGPPNVFGEDVVMKCDNVVVKWCAAAWDLDLGYMYLNCGGHRGYPGNEVYRFDLATGQFERITNPNRYWGLDPETGEWRLLTKEEVVPKDGEFRCVHPRSEEPDHALRPKAAETFRGLVFHPWRNTLMRAGGAGFCGNAAADKHAWEFLDPDLAWPAGPVSESSGWGEGDENWVDLGEDWRPKKNSTQLIVVPTTGDVIVRSGKNLRLIQLGLTGTNESKIAAELGGVLGGLWLWDKIGEMLMVFRNSGVQQKIWAVDAALNLLFDLEMPADMAAAGIGKDRQCIVHDTLRDRYVVWFGDTKEIYAIDPTELTTTLIANADSPITPKADKRGNLVYTKCAYIPGLDVLIAYTDPYKGLWIHKFSDPLGPPAIAQNF